VRFKTITNFHHSITLNLFSATNRPSIISRMSSAPFDLIVIGGGITGAGIALDATSRGLKVALIEMQDFAAGTSSRSTKLIHGGLRYLKQMEFKLVAEVGQERAIVHRNAPHLTKPEHLLLPIVKGGSLTTFTARLGMTIYEWLAGVKKEEKHIVLNKDATIAAEPLLRKDNLVGGILFYEYRTDDARLTIEVLKEAVNRGTLAINYMKAISFIYTGDKISGVKAQDQFTNETIELKANYVVNATGPWVDVIDDLDKPENQHKLHITKGVHIVVDGNKLPLKQSSYFDTFDKRMIFVIPREGKTYIGTTDTFYSEDVVNPLITQEDVSYLLKCVNDIFPSVQLTERDVESNWVGLRPLIQKPGKGPSEISRKDEIFESASGLITIAGGKLTGYRKMAQRIVDLVGKKMSATSGKNIPKCTTATIAVSGGNTGNNGFDDFSKKQTIQLKELGLTSREAEMLINRFGGNVKHLSPALSEGESRQTQLPSLPKVLHAQLYYCIENELCCTPSDFFIRRIGALYFDIDTVKIWSDAVLQHMKVVLNWNDSQTMQHAEELKKLTLQANVSKTR
jgi:glycerol-3-phosphate dehydrogenase